MKLVPLVSMPPSTLTSYVRGRRGATRLPNGMVARDDDMITTGTAGGLAWRTSPAMHRALQSLQGEILAVGGRAPRVTDGWRDPDGPQATARARYVAWVEAGRPDPGEPGFDPQRHKTAFVAPPGESFHGAGMAIDFDVGALQFDGTKIGSDEAYRQFWDIAHDVGLRPVIRHPHVGQAEAWHWDCLAPPILEVYQAFKGRSRSERRRAYPLTAQTACLLTGTQPLNWQRARQRYVQARLLIHGVWTGAPDGWVGAKTIKALKSVGIEGNKHTDPRELIRALDERGIGLEAMEKL